MEVTMEAKQYKNYSYVKRTVPELPEYVRYKMSVGDFDVLPIREKKNIFLKWKWGSSDVSNKELEASEQALLGTLTHLNQEDIDGMSDENKFWYTNKVNWGRKCKAVWGRVEGGMLFSL